MIETVTIRITKVIKVWVEDSKVYCEANLEDDNYDKCPLMDDDFGRCPFRNYTLSEEARAEREKECFDAQ